MNKRSIAIDFSKEAGADFYSSTSSKHSDVLIGELSDRNIRSLGSWVGQAQGSEPESHRPKSYRVRPNRSVRYSSWVRNDRRGDERIFCDHRLPGGATACCHRSDWPIIWPASREREPLPWRSFTATLRGGAVRRSISVSGSGSGRRCHSNT